MVGHRGDKRIGGVEHGNAVGGTDSTSVRLTGPVLQRVDAAQAEMIALPMLVTTATWQRSKPSPSRRMPPRAVSSTAASTRGLSADRRALRGRCSRASRCGARRCRCRPCSHADRLAGGAEDVGDEPGGRRLAVDAGDGDERDAAVLPFRRTAMSTIASPTGRGLPADGSRCIRRPGPALTSTTPPPCSSSGRPMSRRRRRRRRCPGRRPGGLDGTGGNLGMDAVGHVVGGAAGAEVGVAADQHLLAGCAASSRGRSPARPAPRGRRVDLDEAERRGMAVAAARVEVDLATSGRWSNRRRRRRGPARAGRRRRARADDEQAMIGGRVGSSRP